MTSATILAEFIRSRPNLESFTTKIVSDPSRASDLKTELVGMIVAAALENTSESEKRLLEKIQYLPAVDWDELVGMFVTPSPR
jgi:hypothetical protein